MRYLPRRVARSSKSYLDRSVAQVCPIRLERARKGWSQEKLAKAAGLSQVSIVSLEGGKTSDIKLGTTLKLCRALDMSLAGFAHAWLEWRAMVEGCKAQDVARAILGKDTEEDGEDVSG